MKRYSHVFAVIAMSLMNSAFIPSLRASEADRLTKITIDQPIRIQNTSLTAGSYVIRLADLVNQSTLQIFNADDSRLVATIVAMHALQFQPDPAGKTRFAFYEGAGEQLPALHFWFYPGRTDGLEFRDSRMKVAARSARTTKNIVTSVPKIHVDGEN